MTIDKNSYFNFEGLIKQLLWEACDLTEIISEQFYNKASRYLLESLFLVLREMSYFLTERNPPLISPNTKLTNEDLIIIKNIIYTRDAVGHRYLDTNLLNSQIKLVAGFNFKDKDVEIQYGIIRLYLLKDICHIHKKIRKILSEIPELDRLSKHPMWWIEEKKILEAENILINKLSNPSELLKFKFNKTRFQC